MTDAYNLCDANSMWSYINLTDFNFMEVAINRFKKMKSFMLLFITVFAVALQACSLKRDITVPPSETIPESVMETIKEKYPAAQGIVISILESGKIYRSEFKVGKISMSVVISKDGILNSARLTAENLNDSIQRVLSGMAIAGGISSNYRFVETGNRPTYLVADYLLNGVKYSLTMERTAYVRLSAKSFAYETKSISDLPEGIQKFIKDRNKPNPVYIKSLPLLEEKLKPLLLEKNELAYESSAVFQLPDGTKQYYVYVNYFGLTLLPLIFDQRDNLTWVGNFSMLERVKNFDENMGAAPSGISDTDLAQFKSQFEQAPQFKNFTLSNPVTSSIATLNAYAGVTNYEFNLFKLRNDGPGGEYWHLTYDGSKTMLDSYYSGQAK
jgi:hypothetical protein